MMSKRNGLPIIYMFMNKEQQQNLDEFEKGFHFHLILENPKSSTCSELVRDGPSKGNTSVLSEGTQKRERERDREREERVVKETQGRDKIGRCITTEFVLYERSATVDAQVRTNYTLKNTEKYSFL
jgi:hypothetical protein